MPFLIYASLANGIKRGSSVILNLYTHQMDAALMIHQLMTGEKITIYILHTWVNARVVTDSLVFTIHPGVSHSRLIIMGQLFLTLNHQPAKLELLARRVCVEYNSSPDVFSNDCFDSIFLRFRKFPLVFWPWTMSFVPTSMTILLKFIFLLVSPLSRWRS